ncbi:hypothetical protein LUZ63_014447 [Rhynchospora breviuscula]|uniref:Protein kinase domain-containing protein n=1 Tax=Rhynchospora breviuscula TaxID=2022672 RepID=A0A9Q0CAN8_9POAL|nr:hypothetical protein LUZ63_014447 [Rhynchospora breviuscula]
MEKGSYFYSRCLQLVFVFLQTATYVICKSCPPCGTTRIPFPLSTDSTCGDPSYKIRCSASNSTLFFDTINNSYPITSISPTFQRLTIKPPFIGNNSCISPDLSSGGVHLNPVLPFNVTSSNTIMLLNCTANILVSPLNCSSNSLCHLIPQSSCQNLPICCTFVAGGSSTSHSIHISTQYCSAYRSYVNLNPAQPVYTWQNNSGLELQWASPREPLCTTQADCEDSTKVNCKTSSDSAVKRCFCISPLMWNPLSGTCEQKPKDCDTSKHCSIAHRSLIAGLASGLTAALVLSTLGFILYGRQRHLRLARHRLTKERERILNLDNTSGRSVKNFTKLEMKHATNNFSHGNLLGVGGYGEVYKGVLPDGTPIAVKCAKMGNAKSTDQVLNEVRILSQVNHRNLVRLLGCCVDLAQPLMVYEFIPNGTLADHLRGFRSPLSWQQRLSIAHQTAEGLAYLHFSAVPPIYHRDVKSTNILLDEELNAKVSDFGLSRLAESDLSHISTCAQGTIGYIDPEYYRNFQLTDKSDVYSFGVVLLELLTSQKAIDFTRPSDDVNLAIYVQRLVLEGRMMDVVDSVIKKDATEMELDAMKATGFLAMSCLEESRQNRPSMRQVTEEIEYIMTLLPGDVYQRL